MANSATEQRARLGGKRKKGSSLKAKHSLPLPSCDESSPDGFMGIRLKQRAATPEGEQLGESRTEVVSSESASDVRLRDENKKSCDDREISIRDVIRMRCCLNWYHIECIFMQEKAMRANGGILRCPVCRDETTYQRQIRQLRRDLKTLPSTGTKILVKQRVQKSSCNMRSSLGDQTEITHAKTANLMVAEEVIIPSENNTESRFSPNSSSMVDAEQNNCSTLAVGDSSSDANKSNLKRKTMKDNEGGNILDIGDCASQNVTSSGSPISPEARQKKSKVHQSSLDDDNRNRSLPSILASTSEPDNVEIKNDLVEDAVSQATNEIDTSASIVAQLALVETQVEF